MAPTSRYGPARQLDDNTPIDWSVRPGLFDTASNHRWPEWAGFMALLAGFYPAERAVRVRRVWGRAERERRKTEEKRKNEARGRAEQRTGR